MSERVFTYLGMSDEVSTCDCCGKSDLKCTVAFDVAGEVVYYGTTCAVRNTGAKMAVHENAKRAADKAKELAAHTAVWQHSAHYALLAKLAARQVANIPPGRGAGEFLEPERSVFEAAMSSICNAAGAPRCNVNPCFYRTAIQRR